MKIKVALLISLLLAGVNISYSQSSFLADDGIAVFYPPDFDSTLTPPSMAIEKDLIPQRTVPSGWQNSNTITMTVDSGVQ